MKTETLKKLIGLLNANGEGYRWESDGAIQEERIKRLLWDVSRECDELRGDGIEDTEELVAMSHLWFKAVVWLRDRSVEENPENGWIPPGAYRRLTNIAACAGARATDKLVKQTEKGRLPKGARVPSLVTLQSTGHFFGSIILDLSSLGNEEKARPENP